MWQVGKSCCVAAFATPCIADTPATMGLLVCMVSSSTLLNLQA
jgi:hypothetical protein